VDAAVPKEPEETSYALARARDGSLNLLDRIRLKAPLTGTVGELARAWEEHDLTIRRVDGDLYTPDLHELVFDASRYSQATRTPLLWAEDARTRQLGIVTGEGAIFYWWLKFFPDLSRSLARLREYLQRFKDDRLERLLDAYTSLMRTRQGRVHLVAQISWPRSLENCHPL
jgi:hypothetical protein